MILKFVFKHKLAGLKRRLTPRLFFKLLITLALITLFIYSTLLKDHRKNLMWWQSKGWMLCAKAASPWPEMKFQQNAYDFDIIFIESSMINEFFSPRQLCSIESTAKHNPNARIVIYSLNTTFDSYINLFKYYKNIDIVFVDMKQVFNNTPLSKLWTQKRFHESEFFDVHVSDAARLALLWKHGGIYSDLDFIALKSYSSLLSYENGFGYDFENIDCLTNGFLVFKAKHPYLYYLMEKLAKSYDPEEFSHNGPRLIERTIVLYCNISSPFKGLRNNTNNPIPLGTKDICTDIFVFPEPYFYPLRYTEHYRFLHFFDGNATRQVYFDWNELKFSYSIHLFNTFSFELEVKNNQTSPFIQLASQHCSVTLNLTRKFDVDFYA